MSFDAVSSHQPETLRQAQRWEAVKHRYVAEGLCDRCGAQAAYAHQNDGDSWEAIHPPCAACALIVAQFPALTPSAAWRKILRPATSGSMTPHNAVADNHGRSGARFDPQLGTAAVVGGNQ